MKELTAEDEKIALVELEIARLQVQVADMKKSRNCLVPFYRLPSEILVRIILQTQVPKHVTPIAMECEDESLFYPGQIQHYKASFHDFGYDDEWERAISICSHVYRVCLNTPELRAHIDLSWPSSKIERHMSLSKSHQLTLVRIPMQYQGRLDLDLDLDLDVAVASACFQRAAAADILMHHCSPGQVSPIIGIIKQSAPGLSIFHFDSGELDWLEDHDGISMLNLIESYPALTELSLSRVKLYHSISTPLVHLSRLHISDVRTDHHLHYVLDTLRKTPNLTELVLELVHPVREQYQDISPEDSLTLAHLRKLRLEGSCFFVHRFLMALSPHVPLLQEIHIYDKFPDSSEGQNSIETSAVFQKATVLWKSISTLPLPPAKLIWRPESIKMSILEIEPLSTVLPVIELRILYRDEDLPLYKRHGLEIDSIQVKDLHLTTPWTILFDPIVDVLAPHLTRLEFNTCALEVPKLEHWIQQRKLEGCTIDRIVFRQCGSTVGSSQHELRTLSEYEDLKKSGLVGEVEWIHWQRRRASDPDEGWEWQT
jgi:hypothetical protein